MDIDAYTTGVRTCKDDEKELAVISRRGCRMAESVDFRREIQSFRINLYPRNRTSIKAHLTATFSSKVSLDNMASKVF